VGVVFRRLLAKALSGGVVPESMPMHGVTELPLSVLPVLPGFTYVKSRQIGPHRLPAITDPPAVSGIALAPVARGGGMPSATLELVRLETGLSESELDGVVARMAAGMGASVSVSTYGSTPVHTVLDIRVLMLQMSAVVFRRGDDVILVFAPNADEAWAIAAAYLDATA
jgi:hypothetical protein